jgi:hypothetical protein
MGSISLTFTGATLEEVAELVARWAASAPRGTGSTKTVATPTSPANDAAAIGRVLSGVNGQQSRRLLGLLAEAGLKGDVVKLSEELVHEFGVSGGTAFAGMIGPVNRRTMAILGRPLIDNAASGPHARVWRIGPEDAHAVLEALDRK